MSDIKISLFEIDLAWEQPSKNREFIEEMVLKIPKSDLIILPEMFTTGFTMNAIPLAEKENGLTLTWMKKIAKKSRSVLCGCFIVKDEKENYYNRLYWVTPEDETFHYDKHHLFSYGDEDKHYTPGSKNLIVSHGDWKIQPLICYDLRFPVWSRNTAKNSFDILIYVANWPSIRQQAWERLLPARAIENACFVVGVNRTGSDEKGINYSGGSGIYDFLGTGLNPINEVSGIKTYSINKQDLQAFRDKFPVLKDGDKFDLIP